MLIKQTRIVRLSETDATGIVYFTNIFKYACELFEEYLLKRKITHLFPLVDARSSFSSPLRAGDEIVVEMEQLELGNSSLKASYRITTSDRLVAEVVLTHVALSRETEEKILVGALGL